MDNRIVKFYNQATSVFQNIFNPYIATKDTAIDSEISSQKGEGNQLVNWDNPDDNILQQKGYDIYDEMMTDAEVWKSINAKRFSIISADWQISPASDSESDKFIADFITYVLENMRGSMTSFTFETLHAMVYGHSISEIVFDVIKKGPYTGKWGIREIKPKDPRDFEPDLDDYGNLIGLWLDPETSGESEQQKLNLYKFVIYTYLPKFHRFWGQSDCRRVYKNWWSKDFLLKWWNIYLETFGAPTRVGRYPAGGATSPEKQDDLKNALRDIVNNTSIVIPDDMKIEFLLANGQAGFETAIEYHDSQISKGILGQTLTSGEGKRVGSMALGNVHQETMEDYTTYLRHDFAEIVMKEQIIKKLVDINFSNVYSYPNFIWQPRKGKIILANMDDALKFTQSVLFVPDDINILRERLDFPWSESIEKTADTADSNIEKEQEVANVQFSKFEYKPKIVYNSESVYEAHLYAEPSKNWKPPRKLTYAESSLAKRNNQTPVHYYSRQINIRDKIENDLMESLSANFKALQQETEKRIRQNVIKNGNVNLDKINDLVLPASITGELARNLRDSATATFENVYFDGLRNVNVNRNSIPEARFKYAEAATISLDRMMPADMVAELQKATEEGNWKKAKAIRAAQLKTFGQKYAKMRQFWITDVTETKVLAAVKNQIYSGVQNGLHETQIMERISKIFEPYIKRTGHSALAEANRLEAIVRTNITDAYSSAHLKSYTDPSISDYFPGLEYSALIDEGTTDTCRSLDGNIYRYNSADLERVKPPNNFMCRSDLNPVEYDNPDLEEKGFTTSTNWKLIPEAFGGDPS